MIYKNISYITKTFYDVEFKPGETKEVNGIINDPKMMVVDSLPKEPPLRSKSSTVSAEKDTKTSVKSKTKIDEQGGIVNGTDNSK